MFPTAVRLAGALALITLSVGFTRADDEDPEFEGMKVSQWIATVQNGTSARQRALAVDSLGKIWVLHKHKEAIPNICRALRVDSSAAVKAQAAIVLAGMRAEDLDRFSKDLVSALGEKNDSRVRKQIILAMVKFPKTCVLGIEALTESLKDEDPTVKVAAAEAIALAGSELKGSAKGAAPGLVPLLADKEKSVRMAAVYALARIEPDGASTIAEKMAGMLGEKDQDDAMKRELITSLSLLSEKSGVVVKALSVALFDTDDEVRRRAARVLGLFGTAASSATEDLFKVITTEMLKGIRVDAVRAFGSALGPTGVKARLKDLLPLLTPDKQPDYEVRVALVDEIGALGWEHIGMYLTSPDKAEKDTATEVVALLRKRLADPQFKVREAAIAAIRKIEKKPEPKKDPEKKEP